MMTTSTPEDTALPAIMQYSFLLAPLLSLLSAFRMYLIAAGSAVTSSTLGMIMIIILAQK
ncbi:hypothetical protein [Nostoc sp.]|uniref:hypothetical protein n=1 Tax=Nostoc sp. TaxID=1180 RepID=UPI002FF825E7